MVAVVDWVRIAQAIEFYKKEGFEYTEAPWIVPYDILMATCPHERYLIDSTLGGLVGSAEQSFMHLRQNCGLPPGRYVACTPCFRNEDVVDALRQHTFMKVELYESFDDNPNIEVIVDTALGFFRSVMSPEKHSALKVVNETAFSFDIELGGIEIGSYGARTYLGVNWIYGTGLAEPRFSTALSLIK